MIPSETRGSERRVTRVVAAVVSRDDQLLVCRRPIGKHYGGCWEFPGGKCLPGESDAFAIRRELDEELGLTQVTAGRLILEVEDTGSDALIAFYDVTVTGEPVCKEHEEIRWASVGEASQLPLAPSDAKCLSVLLKATP
jgi:8-oxo-dGTP diphosphatase